MLYLVLCDGNFMSDFTLCSSHTFPLEIMVHLAGLQLSISSHSTEGDLRLSLLPALWGCTSPCMVCCAPHPTFAVWLKSEVEEGRCV